MRSQEAELHQRRRWSRLSLSKQINGTIKKTKKKQRKRKKEGKSQTTCLIFDFDSKHTFWSTHRETSLQEGKKKRKGCGREVENDAK